MKYITITVTFHRVDETFYQNVKEFYTLCLICMLGRKGRVQFTSVYKCVFNHAPTSFVVIDIIGFYLYWIYK